MRTVECNNVQYNRLDCSITIIFVTLGDYHA